MKRSDFIIQPCKLCGEKGYNENMCQKHYDEYVAFASGIAAKWSVEPMDARQYISISLQTKTLIQALRQERNNEKK